jgi:predicted nuclease of predicted toxin-antitoxin system
MAAALYADEDFPHPVVEKLRALGHDVLTAQEAGQANQKIPDDKVLAYAAHLDRAILTHNRRDYIRMHRNSSKHAGIVVCTQDPDFDRLARNIDGALATNADLHDQLIRVTRN